MLFSRIIIFFLCYFILPSHTLRCITNCSFTYNFTQPFNIPDQCNQIVSAGKCISYVVFRYTDQTYSVRIDADPSTYIMEFNNKRYECKNTEDCARHLIINATNDILQRQFKVLSIVNELAPLITTPRLPVINSTLTCYYPKDNIVQCGVSADSGQCVVENNIKANSINRSCGPEQLSRSVLVSLYQTPISASFTTECNRILCNDNSTPHTVKSIMFKYKVTVTLDGQLTTEKYIVDYGSKLIVSILLMVFTIILNYHLNTN